MLTRTSQRDGAPEPYRWRRFTGQFQGLAPVRQRFLVLAEQIQRFGPLPVGIAKRDLNVSALALRHTDALECVDGPCVPLQGFVWFAVFPEQIAEVVLRAREVE